MATYRTSDLLKRIHELIEDDIRYVDIYESDEDEDCCHFLSFEGIAIDDPNGLGGIGYDDIDSVEDVDNDIIDDLLNPDDPCTLFSFTNEEVFTFARAIDVALNYYKIRSSSPDCCREEKDAIKKHSIAMRNLQAKLSKKIKWYRN